MTPSASTWYSCCLDDVQVILRVGAVGSGVGTRIEQRVAHAAHELLRIGDFDVSADAERLVPEVLRALGVEDPTEVGDLFYFVGERLMA
jgi:hypothetical protein